MRETKKLATDAIALTSSPGVDALAQRRDVALGDLAVALAREQQRHVDVEALARQAAERLDARVGARDLDHHVRAVDQRAELVRARHRRLDLEGEIRLLLDRDVAVAAAGALPDRADEVAGALDVLDPAALEDLARRCPTRAPPPSSSSYTSESSTALAKIDGFDVPPVT